MAGRVRVLSERVMIKGREMAVKKLMQSVQQNVIRQPGFVRGDILNDTADPSKYIILTEWESMPHLNKWFESDDYKSDLDKLNNLLQKPASYQVLQPAKEEMFLL